MKNKKAIIILIVLILFTLISSVSANDINTTEVSAGDTGDVTGAVNVDLDENYDNDLMDESIDFDNSEILSAYDVNSLQNHLNNSLKEDVLNTPNGSDNNEVLSTSRPVSFRDVSEYIPQSYVILDLSQTKLSVTYYNICGRDGAIINIYGNVGSNSISETCDNNNVRNYNNYYLYSGSYEIDLLNILGPNQPVELTIQSSTGGSIDRYNYIVFISTTTASAYFNVSTNDVTCVKGDRFRISGTYSDLFSVYSSKSAYAFQGYTSDGGRKNSGLIFKDGVISSSVGTFSTESLNVGPNIWLIEFQTNWNWGVGFFIINVTKSTPTVSFNSNPTITYASSGTYSISGKVKSGSTNVNEGTVTLKQGNTNLGTAPVSDGDWTVSNIPYDKFKPEYYSLTAEYSGGNTYNSATGSATLTVNKGTPTIAVTTSPTITYAGDKYTVTGTCNVNGLNVTLKQDNIILGTASVSNGAWTISDIDSTLVNPSSSTVTITATTTQTDYWNSKSATNNLKVNYITPSLSVESTSLYYGSINMPVIQGNVKSTNGDYYQGNLDLYINNQLVKSDVSVNSDGGWTYTMTSSTDFIPGIYDVKFYYKGSIYASGQNETFNNKYVVLQNTPVLNSNTPSGLYGQSDLIRVYGSVTSTTAINVYNGLVNVTVGSKLLGLNVPVADNGTWSFTVSPTEFDPGVYDIGLVYSGNSYTINQTAYFSNAYTITAGYILPTVDRDTYIDVGDIEHVYITVENYMGEYISGLTVNLTGTGIMGVLSNITDLEGKVIFTVPNLPRGEYNDWKVNIGGNTYYNGISNRVVRTFYVREPLSIIIDSISPNITTYPEEIIVIGHSDATNPLPIGNVTLTLGVKTVNATFNSTGFFTASFTGVKPDNYTSIIAEYIPDSSEYFYRGVESTVSVPETGV